MERSAEWMAVFFGSHVGRETAARLAAVNQALHDAWPYMSSDRWSEAMKAVHADLADVGLPPDMRPNAVETVLANFTNR